MQIKLQEVIKSFWIAEITDKADQSETKTFQSTCITIKVTKYARTP